MNIQHGVNVQYITNEHYSKLGNYFEIKVNKLVFLLYGLD